MNPPISIQRLFQGDGGDFRYDSGQVARYWREGLGLMTPVTGNIIVADPEWPVNPEDPVDILRAAELGTGALVVDLSLLEVVDSSLRLQVAAARVRLQDSMPIEWVPAKVDATGAPRGVVCDSGMLSFYDWNDAAWMVDLSDSGDLEDVVYELRDSQVPARLLSTEGGSVLIFESARGDGIYDPWVGLDSNGKAVEVVLDLGLIGWGREP